MLFNESQALTSSLLKSMNVKEVSFVIRRDGLKNKCSGQGELKYDLTLNFVPACNLPVSWRRSKCRLSCAGSPGTFPACNWLESLTCIPEHWPAESTERLVNCSTLTMLTNTLETKLRQPNQLHSRQLGAWS